MNWSIKPIIFLKFTQIFKNIFGGSVRIWNKLLMGFRNSEKHRHGIWEPLSSLFFLLFWGLSVRFWALLSLHGVPNLNWLSSPGHSGSPWADILESESLVLIQSSISQLFRIPFPTSSLQSLFIVVFWFCPCRKLLVVCPDLYCPVHSNTSLANARMLWCTHLFCVDKGYQKDMGSVISEDSGAPPSGIPAYYTSKNYNPRSRKCLQK